MENTNIPPTQGVWVAGHYDDKGKAIEPTVYTDLNHVPVKELDTSMYDSNWDKLVRGWSRFLSLFKGGEKSCTTTDGKCVCSEQKTAKIKDKVEAIDDGKLDP